MIPPGFNAPFPTRDVIINIGGDHSGKPTKALTDWFEQTYQPRINATAINLDPVKSLSPLGATVPVTAIGGIQPEGQYRVTFTNQTTTLEAASTATLTLSWTSNGIVQTETFAAMSGAALTNHQGIVYPLQSDEGIISFTIVYVGAVMRYTYTLSLELVQAG